MRPSIERRPHDVVVIDRGSLKDQVQAAAEKRQLSVSILPFTSVLDAMGERGPATAAGVVGMAEVLGPFITDLLRWTEQNGRARIPALIVGRDTDEDALDAMVGKDHVRWCDVDKLEEGLVDWLPIAVEVADLRLFRAEHDRIAQRIYEGRSKMFRGEVEQLTPPEGPPCGPPLPTTIEEIQSLKEARAQYERGMIRAAVRETGSLKDASSALGISYTSLWRRMR